MESPEISPPVITSFKDRFWSGCAHLGGIFAAFPIVGVVVPFLVWQIFKGESSFLDRHGKESFNFQMTLLLFRIPSYVLMIVFVGVVLIAIVEIISIVFSIIASARAFRGKDYEYPMRYRFCK